MAKHFCECGRRIVVFRRVKTRGKWRNKTKTAAAKFHTLCQRCHNSRFESERQKGGGKAAVKLENQNEIIEK